MKSSERNVKSMTIRNRTACVLALGVVVGLAAVPALSDDSLPTALGNAQPNVVSSTSSVEESPLPEANVLIQTPMSALYSCCPSPYRISKFTCSNTNKMTIAQCRAAYGQPVRACDQCLVYDRVEGNPDEGIDDLAVEALDSAPTDSLPVDPATGSAWTLLIATLFLASL